MKPQVELGEKPTMTHVHPEVPGHEALAAAIRNIVRVAEAERKASK